MTREQRATLIAASVGSAMLLLDVTVVYLALPVIARDLSAGFSTIQWVVDAYAVVLAATLLGAGALSDRIGRRRVFVWGTALFALTSGICALAGSDLALNLARGVQGAGAAAVFASSLALLANEFEGRSRGVALGVWGAVTGFALAVGPLIGGLIVEGANWRWIFLINLPIGLALVLLALRRVPESRSSGSGRPDVAGALLFGGACFLLALGLIRGNDAGWGSPEIVGALTGAAALAALFVVVELRVATPMLPLNLFTERAFSATALVAFAQSVAIYPLLIFLAVYLQDGLGYAPVAAGLRLLPMTLMILVVAPLAGRMTAQMELRRPLIGGLVLLAAALVLISDLSAGDDWTSLLPGMVVGGAAIGAISPSLAAAMVSVLPLEKSGLAAGVNNTFRQLGIAIGVAGLGAIFSAAIARGDGWLDGIVDGLDIVALVAAATALLAALVAWPLLKGHRASAD